MAAKATRPASNGECVRNRASSGHATVEIRLPSIETTDPAISRRKSRTQEGDTGSPAVRGRRAAKVNTSQHESSRRRLGAHAPWKSTGQSECGSQRSKAYQEDDANLGGHAEKTFRTVTYSLFIMLLCGLRLPIVASQLHCGFPAHIARSGSLPRFAATGTVSACGLGLAKVMVLLVPQLFHFPPFLSTQHSLQGLRLQEDAAQSFHPGNVARSCNAWMAPAICPALEVAVDQVP